MTERVKLHGGKAIMSALGVESWGALNRRRSLGCPIHSDSLGRLYAYMDALLAWEGGEETLAHNNGHKRTQTNTNA